MPPNQLSGPVELEQALCAALILLVPLAAAGIALMNAGLGRSRSAAHAILSSLCVMSVAALVYFVCGFSWQGFPGMPAHVLPVGGKPWSLIAAEPFFFRGLRWDGSPAALAALLQMFSVGIAAIIPVGAGSGRWRLGASCVSAALLAGWTYPVFAHWVWGGGWLAQLGANYGLGGGFVDAGGGAAIHTVGGLTALSIVWILGPRQGRYTAGGLPAAMPAHNAVLVLFACFFTWLGVLGLNGSGALLLAGAAPAALSLVAVNTTLSAAAATLSAAALTRVRFGRPDASLSANGWTGGLVASSAGCAFLSPAAAAFTGVVAGVLVALSVEWLDARAGIDDPAGAISVHGVGGIWGILALGIFDRRNPNQFIAQLVGVAVLLGFVLPMSYLLNRLLNHVYRQRVSPECEPDGLDLYELGAEAYPEFVRHREDYRGI